MEFTAISAPDEADTGRRSFCCAYRRRFGA